MDERKKVTGRHKMPIAKCGNPNASFSVLFTRCRNNYNYLTIRALSIGNPLWHVRCFIQEMEQAFEELLLLIRVRAGGRG